MAITDAGFELDMHPDGFPGEDYPSGFSGGESSSTDTSLSKRSIPSQGAENLVKLSGLETFGAAIKAGFVSAISADNHATEAPCDREDGGPIRTVYLAGGITGLTYDEAVAWRRNLADRAPSWLKVISPMRAKGFIQQIEASRSSEGRIRDRYDDHALATAKGITTRDLNDVARCDAVLINLMGATRVSIGTMIEVGAAYAHRKPIIIAMEKDNLHVHSMVEGCGGYILADLDEAFDLTVNILSYGA